jgi:hypothetical protein
MARNASLRVRCVVIEESIVGCCHLAVFCRVVVLTNIWPRPLGPSIAGTFLKVKYSERADITESINMDCEFSEEVNDLITALRE